ncbi:hypothetical protein HBH56_023130 [Parastagonospora nodorum]|nr:hypothetical protein HBH56_023130 [Parastagonospora nodorum]KAH3934092.1 hypothetical protein HBH54_058920 [Parastagonospora nodorum]KAH4006034.1 hypothetical protein HBI10_029970 [Parastagonospora nodorum]KAH4008152.1 hypothetical protein HBI13_240700 [Parastagonospora nodorum]KAH4313819.1 hypothetical protein HBI02_067830 [Parastagonospora nodorum]
MQDLIVKYSNFQSSAVLTGATGSLGAHVLAQLIARPDIQTVHYLQRKIYNSLSPAARQKTHALPSDLPDPQLGLDSKTYQSVTKNLRSVIHCPWSVNFNLSLSSFKKDCIAGVRHLIDLCLAVPGSKPASFDFCSSVSTVSKFPQLHTPETMVELDWA